jgi:MraZ protein
MTQEKLEQVVAGEGQKKPLAKSARPLPEPKVAFRGNFSHALDDKGRVSLPSEFRKVLSDADEKAVVLTNYISDGARCLEGFGVSAWVEFEEKLREKSRFNPKLHKLENFYLSRAAECPIDGAGRILIPQHLRQYAGLERDLTFTSSIHGFRVWDARVWNMIFEQAETALMENPEVFSDIDL